MPNRPIAEHAEFEVKAARRKWNPALHPRDRQGRFIETGGVVRLWGGKLARVVRALPNDRILVQNQSGPNEFKGRRHTTSSKWVSMVARPDGSAPTENPDKVAQEDEERTANPSRGNGIAQDDDGDPTTPNDPHDTDDQGRPIGDHDGVGPSDDDQDEPADGKLPINVAALPNRQHEAGARFRDTAAVRQHFLDLAERPGQKPAMAQFLRSVAGDDQLATSSDGRVIALRNEAGRWYLTATGTGQKMDGAGDFATPKEALDFAQRLARIPTPAGQNSTSRAGFDFSDPELDRAASTWRSVQGENIQAAIQRTRQEFDSAPAQATANREGAQTPAAPAPRGSGVIPSPDEVNAPAAAARASKAPSAMNNGEIRDEIVSLMEREMANGGDLEGMDRTRLRVLEAEEARRAGRKPKPQPKPQPKTPAEEPGGLFDTAGPQTQQRFAPDPSNPNDQADDQFGTPDMIADAEGRDTRRLRPPQSRKPADLEIGDRFVDAGGRTRTVAEKPMRTSHGRIRVVDEDGRESLLAPDMELRVLRPNEDAPRVPETAGSDANAPDGNAPDSETPAARTAAPNTAGTPPEPETSTPNADGPPAADSGAAPSSQVRIDHSGTGTTVRFPTPNGMVSDEEFAALRSLGFKGSRDRTQPRFFYLPSNMTLSRREDKVRQLQKWLDGRGVAYDAPQAADAEKPELTPEQLDQLKGRYRAPMGTWATTDFQPGDEVWTGYSWDTVDSVGPKNLRLQGRGSRPFDSVLARRRGGEIRTIFDAPADDGTPRPGTDDPKIMRDEQITAELARLRGATLPEGNDPTARAVRRQVSARVSALADAQSERTFTRRRDETGRRDLARLVRDPVGLARLKGEQVQGRDGALIGAVYKDKRKWVFADRDGRTPGSEKYPSRAAAITALNKLTDQRNQRAGEGWKYSSWDDVQPGETVRVPELGRREGARARTVTGWSEPLQVSEIRRGDMGQVVVTGRRGDEDVQLELPRTDATFGTSKPGTVPDRTPGDAGGGMDWRQMRRDDFGQDESPPAAADQNKPRPPDRFGTPDIIGDGAPAASGASNPAEGSDAPGDAPSGDKTETARPGQSEGGDTADNATAPDAPIRQTPLADMTDDDIKAELEDLLAWQRRYVSSTGEGPRVQGNLMLALSPVANRRGVLEEEQRQRDNARRDRERKEKQKQERAAALARAEIGKRSADGSYPVTVDGEDTGTVRQLGRQWQYTNADGQRTPDFYPSRAAAVAALVYSRDVRRENTAEAARQEQARSETPEGWVFGDRNDVAENDIVRLPITRNGRDGKPYPVGWSEPVRVTKVEELRTGTLSISVQDLDGSRTSGLGPYFMEPDGVGFVWAEDRTRPEPTPAWRNELRVRMADIGDDIATLQRREGLQDPARIQRLQDLIQRVSRGETDDLQGDLRQIRDEAAWLEGQFDDPNLELPYETVRTRSWATAARRKAERALRYPDFQGTGSPAGAPQAPSAAPELGDEFAAVRQRYGGDMVPASDVRLEDWVHTVSADPAYNEPMHMVGRVIYVTPLSNGQVRIEVEARVTLNGKESVRTEVAMIRGTDLVERLPEGNPGREDSSDLARRIEGDFGRRHASKVPVPEGWRAVDGSQIQPRPGDRFRIVARRGGGSGPHAGKEHMNVTVERPAERDGYWRVKGQPLSFRTSDIVAVPDGSDAPETGVPNRDGQDSTPDPDGRASRARSVFGEGMNAVGGDSLPEIRELDDRLGRADSAEDRDAELRDIADRMDALAGQYELAGPQGELAAGRFRRAARLARGGQDDREERRGGEDQTGDGGESGDSQSNATGVPVNEGEDPQRQDEEEQRQGEDPQRQDEETSRRGDSDPDGGAGGTNGEPGSGGAGTPGDGGNSGGGGGGGDGGDGPENEDDPQDGPEGEQDNEKRRRRQRRNNNGGGGNSGPSGGGTPNLPRLPSTDSTTPPAAGGGNADSGQPDGGSAADARPRRPRYRDVDALRNAWRSGDELTPAEDTPQRRALLSALADREGLALSPGGGLATYPEPQDDGSTVWRFAQARNGTNLPGITLASDDPEQARALAGRFEDITDRNGDPFDWDIEGGRSAAVAAWRDGEGRNLPQALRAVQDDFEQERAGAFTLPDDLTSLKDSDLEAAAAQGLGPEDMMRVMAEMDRRDGYVDARIRAALPQTPPANAAEAEREGRVMDEALRFGDTDPTRPAPATPGRLRREFDALDEGRFQAAMQATGGRMLSPEAEAQGIDPRAVFSGGKYSNRRAQELASPELNQWFDGDDQTPGNGRLTYPQYRQRESDRALRAEFADWDEARYRQAVDFTNGYFFKRQYMFGAAPFDERELFSGGSLSARDRWQQYASEELQEWFDNNGGRQTFAMFRQSRRDNDRAERQQYEEEQQRAASSAEDAEDAEQVRQRPAGLDGIANDRNARLSKGGRILVYGNQAAQQDSNGFNARYRIATAGTMLPIVHDDLEGFRTRREALQAANVLEEEVRDADGQPFPWDAPDAAERARTFRGPDGETLADTITRVLSDSVNPNGDRWQFDRDRAQERAAWRQQADDWHRQQAADGYTIQADPDDLQPGDEVSHPTLGPPSMRPGPSPVITNRATIREGDRTSYRMSGVQALGSQRQPGIPARGETTGPDGERQNSNEARLTFGVVRRRPRPGEATAPAGETNGQGSPDPINGQTAHWARVEDLVPGDMVRINGTTNEGRPAQRAGYVRTAPELVDVTRSGRTDQMWRTWLTENPDGSGPAGNVYTSANATAARAAAPDDTVPGSPASGAQAALRSGDLPDQIPAGRDGRGLFPGSTVTGTGDRTGTITGATSTTVSVRWADGNNDPSMSPTSLSVTDGQRPDGWTADGRRVTARSVVSGTDGAPLGPVDGVDGDDVTIATAGGPVTRSAGDLRVTGEVRDDAPDTAAVTGIDEPAAADLRDGDVVLLDLDGQLTAVALTGPPSRDGDRVTFQYADTTTGEMGEMDVDARAVLPRAQGPDGGAPALGPDNAAEPADDLVVHPTPRPVAPVTGSTLDADLNTSDRSAISDHANGPDEDPDAQQAAVRIAADLPVTPEQAAALAAQLRASADPSKPEGRAALRAADHLDRAAGRTPPAGLDRPRPSNASRIGEGDLVAMPDERRGDQVGVFRVIDAEDGPGGVRSFLLEDENRQWRRRVVHGAMPVWQLPEAAPDPVTPPDVDEPDTTPDPAGTTTSTPAGTPGEATEPVARVRPGSLRAGDVIDAPTSRAGYQLNDHRRLTIISEPQRNGWWMQLTGVDEDGNVYDFGLHSSRAVNVYDRNRPTPALPQAGQPRDPNQASQTDVDRMLGDHARTLAARIIDEAVRGTEPAGSINALREQIAQRLTAEALREARQSTRRDGSAALDAAGLTGRDRADAQRRLRDVRDRTHRDTVRAALRTINDLEPLPGESAEDLAARARDLLRLIPEQVARRSSTSAPNADPAVTNAVTGHADDAVNALLRQLQAAGVDPGDAARIARILTQQMARTRQAAARRIADRVTAANPAAGRQPGLMARIVALLIRMAQRLAELVKAAARKIGEQYENARERGSRLRAFLGRMVRRVREWPETRRLARMQRAVNLPDADGDSLAGRISHWAGLMPEPGRFGQAQRRVTFWRPTTWGQLAAGRLPDRSDRIQWTPDRAADGGPGLTALRHMAALRAAGSDVDQDVTRRLSAALGDDFGDDPHATLQHADDYVASSERRLVNLQAARTGATIPADDDLEIEITAARAELRAARGEYADLRARYAAAVPDAVAAALADVRDMGPQGANAIVFGPDSDPDAERAVRGVQRLIPRAWLNTPEARRLTAVDGAQGRYEPDGQRVTVADLADEGMGTAGYALAQHFARQLGDLDAAQRAFWFGRTYTGRPGARRMRRSPLARVLRRQQTQPETGDTLARSVQAMFSGDWYQDDGLRAFLLGLMATR